MQASERLSDKEGSYLEIIERKGKTLLALINDILDISKIEAGRMDVRTEQFSLSSAIKDTVGCLGHERYQPKTESWIFHFDL